MKKTRIISLTAVVVLLLSLFSFGVYAAETEKSSLTATVESTVLIAGDDAVSVKINDGTIVSAVSSDPSVATFDLTNNKIVPVGKGDATITITNDKGATTTLDVKVYGSALSLGIETTLLGMGIVFAVLILIWAILAVFGKIFSAQKKEKPVVSKAAPAPAPVAAPAAVPAVAANHAASNDEELVAAITAAISLCMDMPMGSFRVVSFRKTNTKQAWNKK